MESLPKKPRLVDATVASPPQHGLSTLPPSLVSSILRYVLHEHELQLISAGLEPLPNFQRVATVSKEWFSFADELASESALRNVAFAHRKPMTRRSMLDMRRSLTLRGGYVRQIQMRGVPDFGAFTRDAWAAALSYTPRLQEINFGVMDYQPPSVRCLAQIVEAAALQCPTMESLIFSRYIHPRERHSSGLRESKHASMKVLTTAVFDAMKVWSKSGGLRRLNLGMHDFVKNHETTKEYIDNVITFAPNIRILSGADASMETSHYVLCKEQWLLDLDTWERFCSTSSQLERFNWVSVPFATEFFEIFSKYPKKNLRILTLTSPGNWNWRRYFSGVDVKTKEALEASGHGATARNVFKVLEACPNLYEVSVDWFDMPHTQSVTAGMNPEVFGDDFCEALARNCKQLITLNIMPAESVFIRHTQRSLMTLTDRSMVALATLPELTLVQLARANITGDGLFELVVNHKAATKMGREYVIYLSDNSDGDTSRAFYTVMLGFLERLAAHDGDLPCVSRPVMLQLINSNQITVDEGFGAEYFAKALLLVDKIKQKHPTIVLRGLVSGYDSEYCTVRCIKEFGFATKGVVLPDWEDPDDSVLEDSAIDGVFVDRQYVNGEDPAGRRVVNMFDFFAARDAGDGEEDEFDSGDENEDEIDDDDDDDGSSFFSDDMDEGFDFDGHDGDY